MQATVRSMAMSLEILTLAFTDFDEVDEDEEEDENAAEDVEDMAGWMVGGVGMKDSLSESFTLRGAWVLAEVELLRAPLAPPPLALAEGRPSPRAALFNTFTSPLAGGGLSGFVGFTGVLVCLDLRVGLTGFSGMGGVQSLNVGNATGEPSGPNTRGV